MSIRSFVGRGARKVLSIFHNEQPRRSNRPPCQVLFVNGCGPQVEAPRRYRVTHQREQLEAWGISTDEVYYDDVLPSDADCADVIVAYRCPITPNVRQLIETAHRQGKKVFFDVDDLVISTSYTDELPMVKAMSSKEKEIFDDGVTRNGRTLAMCDGAIVTTQRLAQELAKVVPTVLINRNTASAEMVSLSQAARQAAERSDDEVLLGYFSGSMTHNADFMQVLPALVEVLSQRPNTRLKVVGDLELPQELVPFSQQVVHAERVHWRELPKLIASVDINLAPIEPTLFNEAKSENKWVEAALVGVPTVASDFGAFAHAIRNGQTGLLCKDSQEWKSALLRLVDDAAFRRQLGEQARLWCLAHNTTITTGTLLADFLVPKTQRSIQNLLPSGQDEQAAIVDSFLQSRGFVRKQVTLDDHPWEDTSLEQRVQQAQHILLEGKRLAVFVYERSCGDDATFRYFGYNLTQRLAASHSWGGIWLFVDELDAADNLIEMASVMLLIRCRVRPELVRLARKASTAGIAMGYLIDDNALGAQTAPRIIQAMASDPNSTFERDFWTGTTQRFGLASQLTSATVVPLGFHADLLRRESDKPVLVVHSSLNDEQVGVAQDIVASRGRTMGDDRFVIGYFSGTASHQDDFELVRPALLRLLSEDADTCLLLGGHLNIDEQLWPYLQSGQLVLMPRVDYVTLQYLQSAVDVVLAPLVVDDFTNCKSALKVFEAGVTGTTACASPSFAYTEAIADGVTGFLCSDEDAWYHSLAKLRDDRRLCDTLGEEARSHALAHYYGQAICEQIEQACDALAALEPSEDIDAVEAAVAARQISDWDNPFEASPAFA